MDTRTLEREVSQMPFLMLGLDLPPPPLFKDVMEKNIIPQVTSLIPESCMVACMVYLICEVCGEVM